MRGVSEDEDIAASPPVGDLRTERVLGDPQQRQVAVRKVGSPGRDEWPQCGQGAEVIGAFVGEQLKLPSIAGLSDAHAGARANRIAHLVHALPLAQVGVGAHIDANQRCSKFKSRMAEPIWVRTTLLAPSQPSR